MIESMLAGFFGTVSLISIIANIRYAHQNEKLREENKKIQEKVISFELVPWGTKNEIFN
jgi:hypothetical protein